MRVPLPPQSHVVKRMLPRTLLGRSLLIILIPLVIVLAVAVQIFYGSHLNLVSRRFTASIAGEIAMVVDGLQRFQRPADRDWILRTAFEELDLLARYEAGALLDDGGKPAADDELVGALHDRVGRPFRLEAGPDEPVRAHPRAGARRRARRAGAAQAPVHRHLWPCSSPGCWARRCCCSASRRCSCATRCARSAASPTPRRRSAWGATIGPIKPEGASEVRQAGTAFNRMQERIRRFLQQRTEMLAGVSHDLRTPLTRLRLALAMLPARSTSSTTTWRR